MEPEYNYIPDLQYSDDVLNAVRFGYQYRIAAEEYIQNEAYYFNWRLPDAPDVILWLANLVFNGITWDAFKVVGEKVVELFHRKKQELPPEVKEILSSQQDFRKLYEYVKEFKEGRMSLSDKEAKYVYEEILADYSGKEAVRIFSAEGRFPTMEESKRINQEAHEVARIILSDKLCGRKNKGARARNGDNNRRK